MKRDIISREKLLPLFFLFGQFKLTLGFKIFGNFLYIPLGLWGWVKNVKEIFRQFWFLPAFILCNLLANFFGDAQIDFFRLGYLCLVTGIIGLGNIFFIGRKIDHLLIFSIASGVLVTTFEYAFKLYNPNLKYFYGHFYLPQFPGLVGEANFSGLFFLAIMSLAVWRKKFWSSVLSFVLIIMSGSKGAFVSSFILWIGFLTLILPKIISQWVGRFLFFIPFIYPILVKLLYRHFQHDMAMLVRLEQWSSARFILHNAYMDMGLSHFWGTGYFQGNFHLHEVIEPYLPLIETLYPKLDFLEQHNLFIQVLSEGGILSFLSLLFCLLFLIWPVSKRDPLAIWCFSCFLLGGIFLNALSFAPLYLWIGLLLQLNLSKEA